MSWRCLLPWGSATSVLACHKEKSLITLFWLLQSRQAYQQRSSTLLMSLSYILSFLRISWRAGMSMPPSFSPTIEHDYEHGLTPNLYSRYHWSWSLMIYSFLPKPIQPVMVLELPYSVENFEDVVRHLNSNDAVSEARGTLQKQTRPQTRAVF